MDWSDIERDWDRVSFKLHDAFELFSDADMRSVRGRKEDIVNLLAQRYDMSRQEAEVEVETWRRRLAEA